MIKIVLVRHGQSVWNFENKFTGWTDVELSNVGIEEAKLAGKLIKKANLQFNVCFTSYLKRAIQTLEIIQNELKEPLLIFKDWRLNERHYGALQGLNKDDIALKYGQEKVRLWRRSAEVRPPLLNENDARNPKFDVLYKKVKANLPLGESLVDTKVRVVECYENFIKSKLKPNSNCLLVAHGNSIRALIQYLDNISNNDIVNLEIPTGEPLVYEFSNDYKVICHYYLKDKI